MVSLPDRSWWQTDHQASPDPDVSVVDPWELPTAQSTSSHLRSRDTNTRDGAVAHGADSSRPCRPRDPNEVTDLSPSNSWPDDGEWALRTESGEIQPIDFDSFLINDIKTDESFDFRSVATFDDEARQSPWKEAVELDELADSRYFIRANEKAAGIVDYFEYKTPRERDDAYRYLVEFFSDHSHNKTFESIRAIALKGPDLELLRNVVNLRMMWVDREDICDRWRFSRFYRSIKVTWEVAYAVCIYRQEYPVEEMIDDGWVGEWLEFPIISRIYWSFSAFLAQKIADSEVERLHNGLNLLFPREPDEIYEEAIDQCRRLICSDAR